MKKQNCNFKIAPRHFLKGLWLKTNCIKAIQASYQFWFVVNKCLQAIFVPERPLRWARLLFLGDRTDCLLCVAVGHFCLFSLAVFPSLWSASRAFLRGYFCLCRYLPRVKKTFTCVIFLPCHIRSQDHHKCLFAIMCSEIEGACDKCGCVFVLFFSFPVESVWTSYGINWLKTFAPIALNTLYNRSYSFAVEVI